MARHQDQNGRRENASHRGHDRSERQSGSGRQHEERGFSQQGYQGMDDDAGYGNNGRYQSTDYQDARSSGYREQSQGYTDQSRDSGGRSRGGASQRYGQEYGQGSAGYPQRNDDQQRWFRGDDDHSHRGGQSGYGRSGEYGGGMGGQSGEGRAEYRRDTGGMGARVGRSGSYSGYASDYASPEFAAQEYGGETYGRGAQRHARESYGQQGHYGQQGQYGQQGLGDYGSQGLHGQSQYGEHASSRAGTSHRGKGPKNYSRSDERILEDLNEKLMQSDEIDASEISVQVSNGQVTLEGTVEHRWLKHRIEDLAEACSGVKDVENRIRVQGRGLSDRASRQHEQDQDTGAISGSPSKGSGGAARTAGQSASSTRSQTSGGAGGNS